MDTGLTISLVQTPVTKGDLPANLSRHLEMIAISAQKGADLVVFPELSLTGYELEMAEELAMTTQSDVFTRLSDSAVEHNAAVIAGFPLKTSATLKPTIAAVICLPNGKVEFYSKQYLHQGEEIYCSAGNKDYLLEIAGHRIALAICADFSAPEHSQAAHQLGATLYLVSALISQQGFEADANLLADIATKCRFPVLLSNHISTTGGWKACGKNSLWNAKGELVFCSESAQSGLVLCTVKGSDIDAHYMPIDIN